MIGRQQQETQTVHKRVLGREGEQDYLEISVDRRTDGGAVGEIMWAFCCLARGLSCSG